MGDISIGASIAFTLYYGLSLSEDLTQACREYAPRLLGLHSVCMGPVVGGCHVLSVRPVTVNRYPR